MSRNITANIERYFSAKAAQRDKEQSASSSIVNVNNKRPMTVTPAGQGSPTQPVAPSTKPLKRDSRLGKYFEYDLSKMVNTKGGFLANENGEGEEDIRRKELEKGREKQRKQHNSEIRTFVSSVRLCMIMTSYLSAMYLDANRNPHCRECNSMDIDQTFMKVFKVMVCKACQNEKPEKYSLLTKTECKEVSLLKTYVN